MIFTRLDRFPRPIQLFHGHLTDGPARGPHLPLHFVEATGEFLRGPSQTVLGIHAEQPGHVDHREQEIAQLFTYTAGIALRRSALELRHLLAYLGPGLAPPRPVEADAASLHLQALRV